MKSPKRPTIAFFLALLYAFVAFSAATGSFSTEHFGQKGGMHFSAIPGDVLYSLPASNQHAFPDRYNDAPAAFKTLLHGLSALEQPESQAGAVLLACYLRQVADFPVHLRKSDLIFPFHYFW